jgi:hypothetical protein
VRVASTPSHAAAAITATAVPMLNAAAQWPWPERNATIGIPTTPPRTPPVLRRRSLTWYRYERLHRPSAAKIKVDVPASYPALNEMLSRLIANNPFRKSIEIFDEYTAALPQTDFVAEKNATTVIQVGNRYMMRSPDGAWSDLDGIDSARAAF